MSSDSGQCTYHLLLCKSIFSHPFIPFSTKNTIQIEGFQLKPVICLLVLMQRLSYAATREFVCMLLTLYLHIIPLISVTMVFGAKIICPPGIALCDGSISLLGFDKSIYNRGKIKKRKTG